MKTVLRQFDDIRSIEVRDVLSDNRSVPKRAHFLFALFDVEIEVGLWRAERVELLDVDVLGDED